MSAGDKVTYVYEPFFGVSINGTDIKDLIERNDLAASNLIRQNLTDLFDCRTFYVKRRGQHKNVRNCKKSLARVIKTIRVRYHQVESWIRQSDIKVQINTDIFNDLNHLYSLQLIHLLRDPRAMIRSRLVGHVLNKREPKKVCTEMEEDLKLADILPSDRSDHCRFRTYKKLS